MHRQTNAHLARYNITADQFVCLILLENQDGITQQEMAKRATSDPNTISAMLVLLEKRGLVTRCPHPEDRRANSVKLTAHGKTLISRLEESVKPVQSQLLAQFDDTESDKLADYLKRISISMAEIADENNKQH